MNRYQCLKKQQFLLDNYELVPIRKEDIQKIKDWRNAQIEILRQEKPITEGEQIDYYNNVLKKIFYQKNPEQVLFSFLLQGKCIGYGGLVHINWNLKKGEISFLLDDKRIGNLEQYQMEFDIFLRLITDIAFNELKFNQIFTETFDIRPKHILTLEKFGFKFEKRNKEHILINGKYVDSLMHSFGRENHAKK